MVITNYNKRINFTPNYKPQICNMYRNGTNEEKKDVGVKLLLLCL